MTRKTLVGLAVAVTAATIQLGGCGKTPSQTPAPAAPVHQQVAQDGGQDLIRQHQEMHAALNLTDEQKGQLRAIKARYRSQLRDGDMRTRLEQLRGLVTAETVNSDALEQAIISAHEAKLAKIPTIAAMLDEVRDVLTPEQRTTAVTQINDRWDQILATLDRMRTEGFAELSAGLNLTPEQSQALQALREEDRTLDTAILNDVKTAMTQFLADGNEQTLATSLQAALATSRVTSIASDSADWVASLNVTQRQQLVTNTKAYLQKLKALKRAMHQGMGDTDTDED